MTTYIEKITEPLQQWYAESSIHAFFVWWKGEMKQLVPQGYREALFPESLAVYVTGDVDADDDPVMWLATGNQLQPLTHDDSVSDKEWWHKLNHFVGSSDMDTAVTYLMDQSNVLIRNVAMPVAAINDIESVLNFELDKYIPFKPEDVVFAFSKGEVVEGSEKFPVLLSAIKKSALNQLVSSFESKGVQLSAIDVNVGTDSQPKPLKVNLLPKEVRKKKDWTKIKWNAGLLLAALLLLGFVMYSSIDNKKVKIATLEAQVAELRKDARRAKLLETQLRDSIKAANFLGNLKQNMPSRLMIFKELTQMVPANTYLTRVIIDKERVEVVGESENANALIPILNQSVTWSQPEVVGNVTQDVRTGREKFTIKSSLIAAEETEVSNES